MFFKNLIFIQLNYNMNKVFGKNGKKTNIVGKILFHFFFLFWNGNIIFSFLEFKDSLFDCVHWNSCRQLSLFDTSLGLMWLWNFILLKYTSFFRRIFSNRVIYLILEWIFYGRFLIPAWACCDFETLYRVG